VPEEKMKHLTEKLEEQFVENERPEQGDPGESEEVGIWALTSF
jgi:hypothetical protein